MADTPTAKEMLAQVNAAITSVLAGGQLYEMQRDLQAQVAAGEPGLLDDCYVAVFEGR